MAPTCSSFQGPSSAALVIPPSREPKLGLLFTACCCCPLRESGSCIAHEIREEEILRKPLLMWEREVRTATLCMLCSLFFHSLWGCLSVSIMYSPQNPRGWGPSLYLRLSLSNDLSPPNLALSLLTSFTFLYAFLYEASSERKGPLTHS